MPVSDTITTFYSFTANSVIRSADHNNNFSAFRGHLIAVDGSLGALATNKSYDLGSTARYWRRGYIGEVVADTLTVTSIQATSITSSSINGTTLTGTSIVGTTITGTSIVGTTITGTSIVGTTITAGTYAGGTTTSFTPVIIGSSSAGLGTYSVQVGLASKIGPVVKITIAITWSAHTGTGNIILGGLPYTTNATANANQVFSVVLDSIALTAGNIGTAFTDVNTTQILIRQMPTGGGANAAVPMDTAGTIILTGTYLV